MIPAPDSCKQQQRCRIAGSQCSCRPAGAAWHRSVATAWMQQDGPHRLLNSAAASWDCPECMYLGNARQPAPSVSGQQQNVASRSLTYPQAVWSPSPRSTAATPAHASSSSCSTRSSCMIRSRSARLNNAVVLVLKLQLTFMPRGTGEVLGRAAALSC